MIRRRARERSRGQALVEFAFVLPLFILIVVGIFDFGRAVFAYNEVSNAAREANRVAIVDQTVNTIKDKAIQRGVSLGLDASDIDVNFVNSDESLTGTPCRVDATTYVAPVPTGCLATVKVTYEYSAITPIIGNLVGPITISSISKMQVEHSSP